MDGPSLRTVTAEDLSCGDPDRCATALERGAILVFPRELVPLPGEDDLRFLREELARGMTLKNISYHPHGDYLSGLKGEHRARTRAILASHAAAVEALLGRILPNYAARWSAGKVNFRPLQERGRNLSRHSSNELVHVDAFASGATHGGRTLRYFTNIHPSEPRVWKSAGLFPALFEEFGRDGRIAGGRARGLREGVLEQALAGVLRVFEAVGLPQARLVDTSPYDRAMKRLHDRLKDDDAFQRDESRLSFFEFEPLTSWVCFTDLVSHACVSGQHALVATWTVPREALSAPELSPYEVMSHAR
jgi:hypothetical protein